MSTNSEVTDSGFAAANPSSAVTKPKRYHPLLVALHWLIAILIFAAVLLPQEDEGRERFRPGQGNLPPAGFQQGNPPGVDADEAPQNLPQGGFPQQGSAGIFSATGIHMMIGIVILVLLIVRLFVRWGTQHPEWASTGNKLFDWVGNLTHLGLYVLALAMPITGLIMANQRGLLARTFGIGSSPTPGTYLPGGFRLGMMHGAIWTLLLLLIILHVGAALYHQFILKDNLLGRMWFRRSAE